MKKQEPFRIHAAIFNSLRTIEALGAGDEKVLALEGQYSRGLSSTQRATHSQFTKAIIVHINENCFVRWRCDCVRNANTVEQILKSVYDQDGIPDVILKKITFYMPLQMATMSKTTLNHETLHLEWSFYPYTFRRGLWERLKAIDYPGQKLYTRYSQLRKELSKDLDKETAKRWRDTLMMNKPNPKLTNNDIRNVWRDKPWALLLKEAKGSFELMGISESREA